jgi:hypothetical protein
MNKEILNTELSILKGIKYEATDINGILLLNIHSRKPDFDKWDSLSEKEQLFKLANKKVLCIGGYGLLTTIEQVEKIRASAMEYSKEDFNKPFELPEWLLKIKKNG